MHPPFTTTKCHQLDWLVPLSLHFWLSRSLSRKNWVPTRPAYSTDRGGFKSELLASFPSQLSSIVRVSTQVRVWTVAMLLPRRQDLFTPSTRTTFSDRISLNAFQNGGKPSLWYNFCLGIMISQLLFGIWQPVIIVSIWLKNVGIYLSFFNTVSYLKYLTLNENDDLRKVISWAT